MKWMKAVVCSVLLAINGPAFSEDTPAESPQDYAYGLALETPTPSQWYRVILPLAVYEQSTSPDLRDVRVFNQMGDAVPFSLVIPTRQTATAGSTPLRLFPLNSSPVTARRSADDDNAEIRLRSRSGVEIVLEGEKARAKGQHYLISLPDNITDALSLSQLQFSWDTPAGPWQAKATVYYSRDLKRWHSLREDMPLMDVASGSDRLKLDRIDVDLTLSPDSIRYLLVVLDAPNPTLALKGVSAVPRAAHPESEQIALQGQGQRVSATEAQWQWTHPLPLTSLSILLEGDGVLPVEIMWRSAQKAEWRPLKKEVLYQLDGKSSAAIPLSGELIEAVKITTLNARLPESLPRVVGNRASYELVFNAQGKAPWLLVWGNGAAEAASIAPAMLIPEALRKTHDVANLPEAYVRDAVKLGGEARLTATSASERASMTKTLMVWGVLIVGVLLLALMAWRIWRETQKDDAA